MRKTCGPCDVCETEDANEDVERTKGTSDPSGDKVSVDIHRELSLDGQVSYPRRAPRAPMTVKAAPLVWWAGQGQGGHVT